MKKITVLLMMSMYFLATSVSFATQAKRALMTKAFVNKAAMQADRVNAPRK